MQHDFEETFNYPTENDRLIRINDLFEKYVASDERHAPDFFSFFTSDVFHVSFAQKVLESCFEKISQNPNKSWQLGVLKSTLTVQMERSLSFEQQFMIASLLEEQEKWTESARILESLVQSSGYNLMPDEEKISIHVKSAQLFLEDEDYINAETNCQDSLLLLKYKFIDAAHKYLELSKLVIDDAEKDYSLDQAIVCTILGDVGQQRSQMLDMLMKDIRVSNSKYNEKLLPKETMDSFSLQLKPHQTAILENGLTVLSSTIFSHNIKNIFIDALARLIGCDSITTERLLASMIKSASINASIDRQNMLVLFKHDAVIKRWNSNIDSFLKLIEQTK
ncbi:hypothetical protein ROZALSC1DRAFT_26713 [Rozella allomycis CSF55]|uniref:COP9 signalosome complex subunit 4 n=1 Tax=Rozella allomycis (strain CSF55) TaxID=988480 RepID=A0A075AQY0_ROZAC|nr:hypothetical protein O9G_001465 [Rozella allomycis CSF55]RKP21919.1 hypothetical protein ROZALSC1DRAFT_26713 [Rozella allomycis CSF55]|eukprot:EPZ30992.1 hypothetical protein O9G_001465 [Rozella allomycis CSF55]